MPEPNVSLMRQGLNALLEQFSGLDVLKVELQTDYEGKRPGPWTLVDLGILGWSHRKEFAIWNNTGNVYRDDEQGAVEDDPMIEVTPLRDSAARRRGERNAVDS